MTGRMDHGPHSIWTGLIQGLVCGLPGCMRVGYGLRSRGVAENGLRCHYGTSIQGPFPKLGNKQFAFSRTLASWRTRSSDHHNEDPSTETCLRLQDCSNVSSFGKHGKVFDGRLITKLCRKCRKHRVELLDVETSTCRGLGISVGNEKES